MGERNSAAVAIGEFDSRLHETAASIPDVHSLTSKHPANPYVLINGGYLNSLSHKTLENPLLNCYIVE